MTGPRTPTSQGGAHLLGRLGCPWKEPWNERTTPRIPCRAQRRRGHRAVGRAPRRALPRRRHRPADPDAPRPPIARAGWSTSSASPSCPRSASPGRRRAVDRRRRPARR
ncbi:MAG: hypothetical protein MZV70_00210 [Desulfobacterales bacterium]|nr:hypothetical protein [Desulfobacterales bacterium]